MLTPIQKLIDEARDLQAQAEGKKVELCMLLGDREGAERAKREMYAQIEARQAAAGPSYLNDPFGRTPRYSNDQEVRELTALAKRQGA